MQWSPSSVGQKCSDACKRTYRQHHLPLRNDPCNPFLLLLLLLLHHTKPLLLLLLLLHRIQLLLLLLRLHHMHSRSIEHSMHLVASPLML